ncbi:MAG: hypothetical protein ABSG71_13915 [Thermodesulfobacteriota bacterium]
MASVLERAQEKILIQLVEAERSLPRNERQYFYVAHTVGPLGVELIHPAIPRQSPRIFEGDLRTLESYGLISIVSYDRNGIESFYITNDGFRMYDQIMKKLGQPTERVQMIIREHLESDGFRASYPNAYAKWAQAENLLWTDDSVSVLTTVGHLIREAMQEFAETLVKRYNPQECTSDKSKTVARIRAAMNFLVQECGETERAFLDALLVYWGTVSDLAQRQEHGAQKEGEPLLWLDARRVVFQTAVVMFEIDNTLSKLRKNQ